MHTSLLVKVLKSPKIIKSFNSKDWNLLLRQASSANMLARLAYTFNNHGLMNAVPDKILNHFNSDQVKVAHLHTQVNQEVQELNQLFNKLDIKAIYLKGTAYLLADLPLAQGRFFSDIDLLLNQSDIAKVEIALKCQGWKSQKTDDHDQAYYRDYMHEIPPMQHIIRGTVIDIHHNILPVCNNNIIDISLLSADALKLNVNTTHGNHSYVLAPAAMFLHSAIHLFHEGELEQGLRGLSDLDLLLSHFDESEANFSQQLIDLGTKINQQQSLFYAWRYLNRILNRELSNTAQAFVESYQPKITNLTTIDFIFTNLFTVHHSTTASWRFSLAAQLAYWRGHLLRMPLRLLIPHLLTKSWLQLSGLIKKDSVNINKVNALDPRFHQLDEDK
ncbi:nucleotidyltransferase domain-containing protein [Candidatus Colwellia aromaticivorans]|uniref:nucleotidyltransferase domain-containing protein n=1 Tax=Candidatus Colwellia aromaticivorans TaxID=2267621 RepID=UPI000DF1407C|nr:nucleotidyltransferase family protein [Candidatus Colwellia aromaticivorans]